MDARQSSNTLVMKFGGTSVGSAEAITRAIDIVRDAQATWPRLVVVTSAMSGVTDQLLEAADCAAQGKLEFVADTASQLREKHAQAAAALIPDSALRAQSTNKIDAFIHSLEDLCEAVAGQGRTTPKALDAIASLGERMSIQLLAAALRSAGIEATAVESYDLIVTNDHFQNAHPDFPASSAKTRKILGPLLDAGVVPVTTGFIGATPEGVITTLGRGGSDYSAAILGAILPAAEVWIWTDVDGVMSTDPRIVPEARTISEITYSEVAEIAYYGAKVLHPKTIRPVIDAGIGLRICNTFNPQHPGTRLVANRPGDHEPRNGGQVVRAVTAIRQQSLITIEGRGMLGVPGVAARAFAAVASTGTSVPLITQASSEQSICFAVPAEAGSPVVAALQSVFAQELKDDDIDRIWMTDDVSIVTVVGVGMRQTPGVAGQVFSQLGKHNANVLAIAQGSSEVSISMVVAAEDTERAVRALHELIVANPVVESRALRARISRPSHLREHKRGK